MQITANAYRACSGRFFHRDTTSMSLQGDYKHEEGDLDDVPIQITHGHSKDSRPDLKHSQRKRLHERRKRWRRR